MGRYYSGDIEGKFWFGVQSSADADFFGVIGAEPNYLEYYFSEEDLPKVEEGIKECKRHLKLKKSDEWEARLVLGEKIAKCIKENGACQFDAEL